MRYLKLGLLLGLALIAVAVVGTASAASSSKSAAIPTIQDSQLQANFTAIGGGANPQPSTRTVAHWFGTSTNPHDGVTYGYNMVGADPNGCSSCDVTIPTDIIPVNVVIQYPGLGDVPFNGSDVVTPVLDSPQFALNDYGSTPAATIPSCTYDAGPPAGIVPGVLCRGDGGALSQGDAGNQLQLEDATMRAQFNQTGDSSYHLRLGDPVVHDPITIVVPSNQGTLLQSGRGVIFADVNIQWWATRIMNLYKSLSYVDPTHLPIFLTNNVLLHIGPDVTNCCVIGFHGAGPVPSHTSNGPMNGNGSQPIQTWAWASWVQPGIYSRPDGGTDWALQDIHALSHEISEWADDPFINNFVEPWLTPTAPQYGCSNTLETGDPVVAIGFAKGTNTFEQGPNPNGTQSADGYYHPEDEVFLPWFMRTSPNNISEPVQSDPTNTDNGRYTLMGDLNPFSGFRAPATGC
jgi:hypothetical protein